MLYFVCQYYSLLGGVKHERLMPPQVNPPRGAETSVSAPQTFILYLIFLLRLKFVL